MTTATAPAPHAGVPSDRLARLLGRLRQIVGPDALIANEDELLVYECDGYVVEKRVPDVVVFPASRQQVVDIVCACNEYDVPFVPRGAGTSLAGGTLPRLGELRLHWLALLGVALAVRRGAGLAIATGAGPADVAED